MPRNWPVPVPWHTIVSHALAYACPFWLSIIRASLLPQQEMSEFLTLIEEKLNVNILYAIKKDGGQYYEAMAYSNPVAGQLYTFVMRSYLHGIVKSMDVQLYDSYEPMFTQVRQALDELQNVKADRILEKEDVPTLYAHFFK